jgi:hypothetical protein
MYGGLIVLDIIRLIGVNQHKRHRQRQNVTPKDIYLFLSCLRTMKKL